MKAIKLEVGTCFGALTIIDTIGMYYICKCLCGNITKARSWSLRSGHTKSCECEYTINRRHINVTHGESYSRLYRTWSAIKTRCYNPKSAGWKNYGGRGISVCQEWLDDYTKFSEWSQSNGYRVDLTIDRINNYGNYEPGNCRWTTMAEQAKNKTRKA